MAPLLYAEYLVPAAVVLVPYIISQLTAKPQSEPLKPSADAAPPQLKRPWYRAGGMHVVQAGSVVTIVGPVVLFAGPMLKMESWVPICAWLAWGALCTAVSAHQSERPGRLSPKKVVHEVPGPFLCMIKC